MDQDSFRKLLHAPAPNRAAPVSRGSLLSAPAKPNQKKAPNPAQPAFKPRSLKKSADGPYRDRAAERRLGLDHDYAEVEALAEDFERKNAEVADRHAVEEQRRFLGGDSTHTVLVKGLDFALLEQARARAAAATSVVDDATLEEAFQTAAAPRKRTREDIVRELKSKRAKTDAAVGASAGAGADVEQQARDALEEAKKAGKFRPIGFKPVGASASEKPRKKKARAQAKGDKAGKMRRGDEAAPSAEPEPGPSAPSPKARTQLAPGPEPEPLDPDFDIFADAGEYTGVDLGSDDESDGGRAAEEEAGAEAEEGEAIPRRWIETDDDRAARLKAPLLSRPKSRSHSPLVAAASPRAVSDEEEEEEDRPVRLQPLASSALPSIRELLEMDAAVDKKRKRGGKKKGKGKDEGEEAGKGGEKEKEKRKGDGEKAAKDKAERDYKRLKAYTDKKAGAKA